MAKKEAGIINLKTERLDMYKNKIKNTAYKNIFKIMLYLLLLGLSFVFLFPYIYLLTNSVKTVSDLSNILIKWIPTKINFKNYDNAIYLLNYIEALKNTLLLVALATIGHVIACPFIGYGFARHEFPFKRILFVFVILTIIIPLQIIFIPSYMLFEKLFGWGDTYYPIIIPTLFGFGLKGGLYIFLYAQYYPGLSRYIEESAEIDGCGRFRKYFSIAFPLAKPITVVTIILSLIFHWNDYIEPDVYIISYNKYILSQMIPMLNSMAIKGVNRGDVDFTVYNTAVVSAAMVLTILPLMVIFLVFQRQFTEGLQATGIKG